VLGPFGLLCVYHSSGLLGLHCLASLACFGFYVFPDFPLCACPSWLFASSLRLFKSNGKSASLLAFQFFKSCSVDGSTGVFAFPCWPKQYWLWHCCSSQGRLILDFSRFIAQLHFGYLLCSIFVHSFELCSAELFSHIFRHFSCLLPAHGSSPHVSAPRL